ncbi:Rad52/Rad22 family DNA repair protein [Streptomyces sp. NPDC018059]|uniref:Rad52/Rad22 family DNA repair protein n=1 Tax=Streptomyces sp. NPDC018059 TaxID=3365041 RepID=UPI0037B0A8F8
MATAIEAPATAEGPVQHTLSTFPPEQVDQLASGIDPSRVKHTENGAAHLEQWDVRRRLNQVFGFGGWADDLTRLQMIRERDYPADQMGPVRTYVAYLATVRLTILRPDGTRLTWYEDVATGDATSTISPGEAHGDAVKSAVSGALKRAAINLGDQFGLSLYNGGSVLPVVVPNPQAHIEAVLRNWGNQDGLRRAYNEAKGAGVLARQGTIPDDVDEELGLAPGTEVVIGPWITERGQELDQDDSSSGESPGQQNQDGRDAGLQHQESGTGRNQEAPSEGDGQQSAFPPFEPIGYSSSGDYDSYPDPDPEHEAVIKVQELAQRSWDSVEGMQVTRQMAEQLGVLNVLVLGADLSDHKLGILLDTRLQELQRAEAGAA